MKQIAVLIFILLGAGFLFAQSPGAVIREMTGTVELKKSSSSNWVAAKAGDKVEKSTIISTGFKSTAILGVGSSTIMVRPLTRLSLEELMSQEQTETINISLNTGRMKVEINAPAGGKTNATFQSPSATASVRGTSFNMDPVSIQVLTGAVSFSASDNASSRPVTVKAGQKSLVNKESNKAVNPMVLAEVASSLPNIAGQSAGATGGSARINLPRGELEITISVSDGL